MNEIFMFSPEESTKDIPLTTLSQSLMIRDAKGQAPKNRPIQSWELIETVEEACQKYGIDAEVKHIYVPKPSSTPVINREEKEIYASGQNIPIEKWLFNRVAFMVQLRHAADARMVTAIVGSFHDKGIQLAWGQHVNICSNMCIFGENSMYTFGDKKMPYEKMMEVVVKWISEFEVKRNHDLEIIEQMKAYVIAPERIEGLMDALVGRLYRNAVKAAYHKGEDQVFNISQCSEFVQHFETEFKKNFDEHDRHIPISLWDLYNYGTAILSPENTDIVGVYSTVTEWGSFLADFMAFNEQDATSHLYNHDFQDDITHLDEIVVLEANTNVPAVAKVMKIRPAHTEKDDKEVRKEAIEQNLAPSDAN